MTHIEGAQEASPGTAFDAASITLRRLETLADYEACCAIQEETWGEGFRERVPIAILMVAQKIGGVTAGAFDSHGRLLGFVFGLTGLRDGRLVHWSDMLAVRTEARGRQLGARLKQYQRALVRTIGVERMLWTFDPLVARNAHFNINRLGASASEYVTDMYGANTGSVLHGTQPTDRIIIEWDLATEHTRGRTTLGAAVPHAPVIDPVDIDGVPGIAPFPETAAVRIQIPDDVQLLDHDRRATWRSVTRASFLAAFERGYRVTGFERGSTGRLPAYELSRSIAERGAR